MDMDMDMDWIACDVIACAALALIVVAARRTPHTTGRTRRGHARHAGRTDGRRHGTRHGFAAAPRTAALARSSSRKPVAISSSTAATAHPAVKALHQS